MGVNPPFLHQEYIHRLMELIEVVNFRLLAAAGITVKSLGITDLSSNKEELNLYLNPPPSMDRMRMPRPLTGAW